MTNTKMNQIITILDTNGLDQALQALCQVKGHDREIRLYAVWCAQQVQHLLTDQRLKTALDVSERFANGLATAQELAAASSAAEDAAQDVADDTARATQWSTSWNASQEVALAAASCAASCVATTLDVRAAACAAIGAAAGAAGLEVDDQFDAADVAREAQELRLREVCATQNPR